MRYIAPKKAYLDSLCGSIVRARGYCQNPACHKPISDFNPLVWSHIIPRGYLHLRWLPENALCLCFDCERYFTDHPLEQRELFILVVGEDKYWELKRRSHIIQKVDYQAVRESLNQIIKEMKINSY